MVATVNYLHGESFVELPQVNVFHFQPLAFEQFGHGEYRTNTHFVRFATGNLETPEDHLVGNAKFVRSLARHKQRRGSAIGKL